MASIALTSSPTSALAASVAVALGASVAVSLAPSCSLIAPVELSVSSQAELSVSPSSLLAPAVGLTVIDAAAMAASPSSQIATFVDLSVLDSVALSSSPSSQLTPAFNLSVTSAAGLGLAPSSSLAGQVALIIPPSHSLGISPSAIFTPSVDLLIANTALLTAAPSSALTASVSLSGLISGMTLRDVVDELLGMWGIFNRCGAPEFAIDRAINDTNSALQLVWNNADERDYWSRSPETITLADGESSQALADDIQNVVGPCRLASTRRPLAAIDSIGELETFADIFLDGETPAEPVAYHIARTNQSGADPANCVFHCTPAAVGPVSIILDVVKEAPRFGLADLVTNPAIPIPHQYVETLLLPIARHLAASFYLFRQGDKKESIEAEYMQAQISLGLADPNPVKTATNNKEVAK